MHTMARERHPRPEHLQYLTHFTPIVRKSFSLMPRTRRNKPYLLTLAGCSSWPNHRYDSVLNAKIIGLLSCQIVFLQNCMWHVTSPILSWPRWCNLAHSPNRMTYTRKWRVNPPTTRGKTVNRTSVSSSPRRAPIHGTLQPRSVPAKKTS